MKALGLKMIKFYKAEHIEAAKIKYTCIYRVP